MTCTCEATEAKTCDKDFPYTVVEITNSEKLVLFRKVVIPASMGDETMVPPTIGKYCNVLLSYEANGALYLYSSDGIPTKLATDSTAIEERVAELARELSQEITDREEADAQLKALIDEIVVDYPDAFSSAEWNSLWS